MDRKQMSFTEIEYSKRKRITKKEEFLTMMNEIIDWNEWTSIIRPYYFKGDRGRPPRGLEIMLRMYLLQAWFSLSDEAVEDAIYDSYAMRQFMRLDFTQEQVPDATTLLKFRRIMENNQIGKLLFDALGRFLAENGYMMRGGTIVDATLIAAPSSTKNATGTRDPEMHQTKKGNQWYFGVKCHAGVDAGTGLVHTITVTAANVHDIAETVNLIREDDEVVYGDAGYLGIDKREEITSDSKKSAIEYRINRRRSTINKIPKGPSQSFERALEYKKSSIRSKVEHLFLIIKRQFGFYKVPYRGIAKNLNRLQVLCASANLLMLARAGRSLEKPICMRTREESA
jgi:IS5 family transposase